MVEVIDVSRGGVLVRGRAQSKTLDGGEHESAWLQLVVVEGGTIVAMDFFDDAVLERARDAFRSRCT